MNIYNLRYFRKNYYIKDKSKIVSANRNMLVPQMIQVIMMVYFKYYANNIKAMNITFIIMYFECIILIYIQYRFVYIHSNNAKVNTISKSYLKKIPYFFIIVLILTCAIFIFLFSNQSLLNKFLEYYWIWIVPIYILIYPGCVYIPCIVSFGKEHYYSGLYKVKYSEISRIDIVKVSFTSLSNILFVKIYEGDKLIGFDKLFVEDYQTLTEKVNGL